MYVLILDSSVEWSRTEAENFVLPADTLFDTKEV